MVEKILDFFADFIDENNLISGIIFIAIGIMLLLYQMRKEKPLNFKDSNILGWNATISMRALIFMSFIYGLILLFKS